MALGGEEEEEKETSRESKKKMGSCGCIDRLLDWGSSVVPGILPLHELQLELLISHFYYPRYRYGSLLMGRTLNLRFSMLSDLKYFELCMIYQQVTSARLSDKSLIGDVGSRKYVTELAR
jgi:hypothetical protein